MSTPLLRTFVRGQTERRELQMQTALPAKVVSWSQSDNTVEIEPQFVETWVQPDGVTKQEEAPDSPNISNVPVCYPWHMTWDITVGAFGLVICTKYSLDQWRQQLRRMDPGDLRRFTMSGATFHPVVIGESPNLTQQFVALTNLVKDELVSVRTAINTHVHADPVSGNTGTASVGYRTSAPPVESDVGSTTVKVSE